jgi:NAD(P)-dependent dehydrogenase (short-subunit alcohol dehydrogenase family)
MGDRLVGKRALIVGGTSGIGLATARRFLEEGASLVIAGNDAEQGAAATAQLIRQGEVHFFACDATSSNQVERLFREAVTSLGGLEILFHVAGGSGRSDGDGSLHECTESGWGKTLELNLTSVFLTNREATRGFLAKRQHGVILNTTSVLALSPSPKYFDTCAYTAAKAGILGLSRLAAARYAADGIRVNVLAPGLIDTPMSRRAVQSEAIQSFLRAKQPLFGGPGAPNDCAEAAVYLCSDAARGVTGVVLTLDGGWSVVSA